MVQNQVTDRPDEAWIPEDTMDIGQAVKGDEGQDLWKRLFRAQFTYLRSTVYLFKNAMLSLRHEIAIALASSGSR